MTFRIEEKFFLNAKNFDNLIIWIKSNKGKVIYPERFVSSLYFDTENNIALVESEEGIVPRKKIRIRSYQKLIDFSQIVNIETKITSVEGKYKVSNKINKRQLSNYLKRGLFISGYGVVYPKIFVSYKRYYFSINDINLNIDTKIRYNNYKNNKFVVCDSDIVLELKSSNDYNISSIIEKFPFNKRRFSKYSRGVLYLNRNRSNIINNN